MMMWRDDQGVDVTSYRSIVDRVDDLGDAFPAAVALAGARLIGEGDLGVLTSAASALSRFVDSRADRRASIAPVLESLRERIAVLDATRYADDVDVERRSVRARVRGAVGDGVDRPAVIAERLGLAAPQVSRALADLLAAGEIERYERSDDGRSRHYRIVDSPSAPALLPPRHGQFARSDVDASSPRAARDARRSGSDLEAVAGRLVQLCDRAARAGDRQQVYEAVSELAVTTRQMQDFAHARSYANWLHLEAARHGDAAMNARALYEIGRCDIADGAHGDRGAGTLRESLRLLQALSGAADTGSDLDTHVGWAWFALADYARQRRRLDDALGHCNAALDVFTALDDPYACASGLGQRGFIGRLRGDHADARTDLVAALDVSNEYGFPRSLAHAHLQLAELCRHDGRESYDAAERHLREALGLFDRLGGHSLGYTYGALAALAFDRAVDCAAPVERRRLLTDAEGWCVRASQLLVTAPGGYALMQRRAGAIWRELGNDDAAAGAFTRALDDANRVSDPTTQVSALIGRSALAKVPFAQRFSDAVTAATLSGALEKTRVSFGVASSWLRPAWRRAREQLAQVPGASGLVGDLLPEELPATTADGSSVSEMGQESGELVNVCIIVRGGARIDASHRGGGCEHRPVAPVPSSL